MRFSLRTILLIFLLVGLALVAITNTWKLQESEAENQRLRKIYGTGDWQGYFLRTLGDWNSTQQDRFPVHLIRLDNAQNFILRMICYDGVRQQAELRDIALAEDDWEFALTYSAHNSRGNFNFQSIRNDSKNIDLTFDVGNNEVASIYPHFSNATSKSKPILIYMLCPPDLKDDPNFQWLGQDEEKLKAWCDKYKTKCVYFKFRR